MSYAMRIQNTNTKKAFQCTKGLHVLVRRTISCREGNIMRWDWKVSNFGKCVPFPPQNLYLLLPLSWSHRDKAALLCFSTFPRRCSKSTSCSWMEVQFSFQPSAFPELGQRRHVLALPHGERKTVWQRQNRSQLIWTTQDNAKYILQNCSILVLSHFDPRGNIEI